MNTSSPRTQFSSPGTRRCSHSTRPNGSGPSRSRRFSTTPSSTARATTFPVARLGTGRRRSAATTRWTRARAASSTPRRSIPAAGSRSSTGSSPPSTSGALPCLRAPSSGSRTRPTGRPSPCCSTSAPGRSRSGSADTVVAPSERGRGSRSEARGRSSTSRSARTPTTSHRERRGSTRAAGRPRRSRSTRRTASPCSTTLRARPWSHPVSSE